ncbi:MAG: hypothetical protein ACKVT1_01355 [Dehalococcoidia bacterium]
MQTFWKWPVRNLALALVAVAIATGASGVAEWALALSAACLLAFLAKGADSCYRAAARRAQRKAIVVELTAARSRHALVTAPGRAAMGARRAS